MEKGYCKEHDMRCYQLTELKQDVDKLLDSCQQHVSREDMEVAMENIEQKLSEFKESITKEIERIKMSEKDTNAVVGTIRESLAEIYSTLKAYKSSQDVLRDDYSRVYNTVQDIWKLLQTKFSTIEKKIDKPSAAPATTPWDVLKANSDKLIPLLYAVIGALFFVIIRNAEQIINILLKK